MPSKTSGIVMVTCHTSVGSGLSLKLLIERSIDRAGRKERERKGEKMNIDR